MSSAASRHMRAAALVSAAVVASALLSACGLIPSDPDPGNRRFNRARKEPAYTTQPPGTELLTDLASPRSKGFDPKYCQGGKPSCSPAEGFIVKREYRLLSDTFEGVDAVFAWYEEFLGDEGYVRKRDAEESYGRLPVGAHYQTDSHNCIAVYWRMGESGAEGKVDASVTLVSRSAIFRADSPEVEPTRCTLVGTSTEPNGTFYAFVNAN